MLPKNNWLKVELKLNEYYKKTIWYGPAKLDNKLPKKKKISDEIINFIEKTMKTLKMELTAGGRCLAEAKAHRGKFQGDAQSPFLFIIAMMPLNHIHWKCTAGYKLSKSQEKINHLMYIDDIKLFAKKWKRTGNFNTRS